MTHPGLAPAAVSAANAPWCGGTRPVDFSIDAGTSSRAGNAGMSNNCAMYSFAVLDSGGLGDILG
jgi:hypothetical protein